MRYRQLGSSSLQVSEIGLGCMSLPLANEKESLDIIGQAKGFGVNFFDTADLYDHGQNEILLGKAIRSKRDQVIIATKVGNQWRADGSGWDWNPFKQYIMSAVEHSLQRLQTDYIDLYQLHGGTIEDKIDEVVEAFELLQQQGKIRFYGISSIRPNVIRKYINISSITSVMMQYSLADRRPEEAMLNLIHDHNIAVLGRGSLAQGMLVNKPAKDYLGHTAAEIKHAADSIKAMTAVKHTTAQVALGYVLNHPAITSAIVGCSKLAQLEEIAASSLVLSDDEMQTLRRSIPAKTYEQHR